MAGITIGYEDRRKNGRAGLGCGYRRGNGGGGGGGGGSSGGRLRRGIGVGYWISFLMKEG